MRMREVEVLTVAVTSAPALTLPVWVWAVVGQWGVEVMDTIVVALGVVVRPLAISAEDPTTLPVIARHKP